MDSIKYPAPIVPLAITFGSASGQHQVAVLRRWMYVFDSRPTLVSIGKCGFTSLIVPNIFWTSYLNVLAMGGKWPYNYSFGDSCFLLNWCNCTVVLTRLQVGKIPVLFLETDQISIWQIICQWQSIIYLNICWHLFQ